MISLDMKWFRPNFATKDKIALTSHNANADHNNRLFEKITNKNYLGWCGVPRYNNAIYGHIQFGIILGHWEYCPSNSKHSISLFISWGSVGQMVMAERDSNDWNSFVVVHNLHSASDSAFPTPSSLTRYCNLVSAANSVSTWIIVDLAFLRHPDSLFSGN